VALVLGLLAACQPTDPRPGEPDSGQILRLISEEPGRLFTRHQYSDKVSVFELDLSSRGEREKWELSRPAVDQQPPRSGLSIRSSSDRLPAAIREIERRADELDEIEVVVNGIERGQLDLVWTNQSGQLDKGPHIRLKAADGKARLGSRVFIFEVGDHADWSGVIQKIGLRHNSWSLDLTVRIQSVRGLRYEIRPARLAQAVATPWKVDLSHQVRSAFPAVVGIPIRKRLVVPPGGRLELAYGVQPGWREPLDFTVHLESGESPSTTLLHRPLAIGQVGWSEAGADLSAWTGQEIELVFEVESATLPDLRRGMAFWSDLRVEIPDGTATRPNLVLISIDTLRADHLSLYGYPRQTSPHIDRWASEAAVVFERAVAQAPWTLPSHVSMLSGLHPLRHGVNHPGMTNDHVTYLGEILQAEGYRTLAVTGGGYLNPRYGLALGFDVFTYFAGVGGENELAQGMEQALANLESVGDSSPFFLFFHTYEVHGPHRPREPWFAAFSDRDRGLEPPDPIITKSIPPQSDDGFRGRNRFVFLRQDSEGEDSEAPDLELVTSMYDSAIAYTDDMLSRLLGVLDERQMSDRTAVVLTSDHGEAIGEHGMAGHGSLYDHNLLVPLVMSFPQRMGAGRRVRTQVRLVDIVPTVLDAFGLDEPSGIDGISLLPLAEGREIRALPPASSYNALNNHGLALRVADRYKYIFMDAPWTPLSGREELYRLDQDPGEAINIALADDPVELQRFRRQIDQMLTAAAGRLAIRMINDTDSELTGKLTGQLVNKVNRVKTTDLVSRLAWEGPGKISFAVPAGASALILVDVAGSEGKVLRGRVGLGAGSGTGETGFEIEVGAAELSDPRYLLVTGDGVSWSEDEWTEGQAGLEFQMLGEPLSRSAVESPQDSKLREQLEALGYVN